jgi:GT2 family glycosyltransferase
MNDTPKVAVVVLNWNGVNHLREFLPSVLSSTWPNLDIIVGDNASTDGSVEFIRQEYPQISIVQNDQNYGFTGGYNRVLEHVKADYYILLNSDVEVPSGWIEPVIELMESDPLIAAAAPKIKSYTQQNYFEHAGAAGGFIDSLGFIFCRGRLFYEIEEDKGQYEQSGEVFWASGAAMFIKKHCWEEACGFDEGFFAHMEEIDLCWRLKNGGYKVMYCAQSEVFHLGGGTLNAENPFKTFLNFRNNLLLLKKNLSFWKALYVIPIRIWMDLMAVFRFFNEGKRKDAWAVSRAHQAFFLDLFGIRKISLKSEVLSPKSKKKLTTTHSLLTTHHSLLPIAHSLKGMYKGSIVWAFFVKKKKYFSDLADSDFY